MIKEIRSKKVLTYHADAFPTNWDVNPYRGCSIGCRYCYAQYTHKYLGLDDFFRDILVKSNVHECLEGELKKKKGRHEPIKIGGTTDLYQHVEKKYELVPKIFDVIRKYKTPIFIQTKSTLILRDLEVIRELAKITEVDIATSVSTFDESVRKVIEPGAPPALERVEMLARFKGICRSTTLGLMPVIPYLSDTREQLDMAFRLTKEYGIDHIVPSILFLRGETKPKFMGVIRTHFPEIYTDFAKLYKRSQVDAGYANRIKLKFEALRKKYQLFGHYAPVEVGDGTDQLSLF